MPTVDTPLFMIGIEMHQSLPRTRLPFNHLGGRSAVGIVRLHSEKKGNKINKCVYVEFKVRSGRSNDPYTYMSLPRCRFLLVFINVFNMKMFGTLTPHRSISCQPMWRTQFM